MESLNRGKVVQLLECATAHQIKPDKTGITPEWRSAWMSMEGDRRKVQGVVGRKDGHYYPGVAVRHGNGKTSVDWGQNVSGRDEAKLFAQVAATEWMDGQKASANRVVPGRQDRRPAVERGR